MKNYEHANDRGKKGIALFEKYDKDY